MKRLFLIALLISRTVFGQIADEKDFNSAKNEQAWELQFEDSCTDNWKSNWFLDGLRADVGNTYRGMLFSAGPVENDHACHAVLWTKPSFKGDVKIEYDYTRLDTRTSQVNILYIQATGKERDKKDIFEWRDERTIPFMRSYFDNMNCLHISYAAFGEDGEYVRARKYPRHPDKDFNASTEIPKASFSTGLFKPGITYKITVVKTDKRLYFEAKHENESKLFSWNLNKEHKVSEGRIGLRHMFTRSAVYKDFKVYTKN